MAEPSAGASGRAGQDTGRVAGGQSDFFVSHAGADWAWAEWVAWQLTDAGYTVELASRNREQRPREARRSRNEQSD